MRKAVLEQVEARWSIAVEYRKKYQVVKMYKNNKRNKNNTREVFFIIGVILLIQLLFTIQIYADSANNPEEEKGQIQEEIIKNQLQSPEIRALKDYFNEYIAGNAGKILDDFTADEIMDDAIKGNLSLNIMKIFKKLVNNFVQEIYVNIHILLELIVLVIICALLNNLQNSFSKEGTGEIAFFVCYIILVSILIIGFKEAASFGIKAIDQMTGFMNASIPVIISLLVSSGNITSGGVFKPVLIMIVGVAATVIKNVFVPLIFLSTSLSIVNNISDRLHLGKLADLVKKTGLIIIGSTMTLFIGILAIQGPIGAVVDGVTNKTLKFALGTFIPVVGGYLADAADTVIACTLLIKNAAGIVVMIGVISICIVPILKMSALVLLYKITCAITEPISEKRITVCINDIANSVACILGAVAIVTLMFVISITLIISAGNITAMFR